MLCSVFMHVSNSDGLAGGCLLWNRNKTLFCKGLIYLFIYLFEVGQSTFPPVDPIPKWAQYLMLGITFPLGLPCGW